MNFAQAHSNNHPSLVCIIFHCNERVEIRCGRAADFTRFRSQDFRYHFCSHGIKILSFKILSNDKALNGHDLETVKQFWWLVG